MHLALRSVPRVLILTALALPACSGDEPARDPEPGAGGSGGGGAGGGAPGSQDEISYELFSSTKLLPASALATLTPVSPDEGTLSFASAPSELDSIAVGNVILAGESDASPAGLLRVVTKVERTGSALTLETVHAPIALAFRKLHVTLSPRTTPNVGSASWTSTLPAPLSGTFFPGGQRGPRSARSGFPSPLDTVGETKDLHIVVFDGDGDESTTQDQVRVDGTLGGAFTYFFGLDVDWGDVLELPSAVADCVVSAVTGGGCAVGDLLPEAKVGFDVDAGVAAGATLSGAAFKGFSEEYDIASIDLPKFAVGPLLFFPSLEVKGAVSGSASSQFSVGTSAEAGFKAGVSYSSKTGGKTVEPTFTKAFEVTASDVVLHAEGKAAIGADLVLRLFDILGPKAGVSAYAKVVAAPGETPCWRLSGGLDARYGFTISAKLPVLGTVTLAEFNDSVNALEEEIATGVCQLPPGSDIPLPPGQGPTVSAFAEPTFTPWSATYGGGIAGYPYTKANGLRWIDTERSIDGNFVIASSEARALIKIAESGALQWAMGYEMFPDVAEIPALRVLRTVPTIDAHLFVATYPFGVMKIGQAGSPAWGVSYDQPRSSDTGPFGDMFTQQAFIDAIEDGQGGVWLVGAYGRTTALPYVGTWLLHVGSSGEVLSSQRLETPGRDLYPTVLLKRGAGLLIGGFVWDQPGIHRTGFVLGLDESQAVVFSSELTSCGGTEEMIPTAGIVDRAGDIVLVGHGGAYDRSFVSKFSATDGVSSFFATPWTGSGLTYSVAYGVAELPTTGYLLTGRYQDNVDEWFLAATDAVGVPLSAHRYRLLPTASQAAESGWAAVNLTDDGGALISGLTNEPTSGFGGVWALKAQAKDGALDLAPTLAESEPLSLQNSGCALSGVPLTVSSVPLTAVALEREVTATPQALTLASQTP